MMQYKKQNEVRKGTIIILFYSYNNDNYVIVNVEVELNIYSKLPHPSTKQLKDRYSLIEQLYKIILSNTAV